jgi:hypothetical protein
VPALSVALTKYTESEGRDERRASKKRMRATSGLTRQVIAGRRRPQRTSGAALVSRAANERNKLQRRCCPHLKQCFDTRNVAQSVPINIGGALYESNSTRSKAFSLSLSLSVLSTNQIVLIPNCQSNCETTNKLHSQTVGDRALNAPN